MSAVTHTPGPWNVGTSAQGREVVFLNGLTERHGGLGPSQNWIDCNTEANARLIAAAPELLAVVQELEESAGYWSEYDVPLGIVDRIRAAIAKAEGRS